MLKKLCRILPIVIIIICTTGCILPIGKKEEEPLTIEEVYSEVDLTQFTAHGWSTENDVMWVEKADYTGKMYGCINTKGEYIVPLTSEIKEVEDFDFSPQGFSVVIFNPCKRVDNQNGVEYEREYGGIYNSKGELVVKFENEGMSSLNILNNGNIFFENIEPYGTLSHNSSNAYMFCVNTGKLVEMPIPAWGSASRIEYSDGLMLIYCNFYNNPGAKYFDESGNCCIDLDNSNEYYKSVWHADNFVDGQANVTFIGLDDNCYEVIIDKNGNWINQPVEISEYDAQTFSKDLK